MNLKKKNGEALRRKENASTHSSKNSFVEMLKDREILLKRISDKKRRWKYIYLREIINY